MLRKLITTPARRPATILSVISVLILSSTAISAADDSTDRYAGGPACKSLLRDLNLARQCSPDISPDENREVAAEIEVLMRTQGLSLGEQDPQRSGSSVLEYQMRGCSRSGTTLCERPETRNSPREMRRRFLTKEEIEEIRKAELIAWEMKRRAVEQEIYAADKAKQSHLESETASDDPSSDPDQFDFELGGEELN